MHANNLKSVKNIERSLLSVGGAAAVVIIFFSALRIISANAPLPPERSAQFWAADFLPDGKTLVTVGGNGSPFEAPRRGELILWDLATGNARLVLKEKSSVRAVASSASGRLLAIGEFGGSTKLVNPATGKTITSFASSSAINAVAFSPDNKLVISGGLDGTISFWEVVTGKKEDLVLPGETIINIAISPDGKALAATTRKGKVYLFNLLNPRRPQVMESYEGPSMEDPNAEAVTFSPDGRSLVTGCQKCLRLWDCTTGRLIRELAGSTAPINSAAFSPNGKILGTVDSNGILNLWDPMTGGRIKSTNAHSGISFCITFSPDGKFIATSGRDDFTAKIWDANSLSLLTVLHRNNALPRTNEGAVFR